MYMDHMYGISEKTEASGRVYHVMYRDFEIKNFNVFSLL